MGLETRPGLETPSLVDNLKLHHDTLLKTLKTTAGDDDSYLKICRKILTGSTNFKVSSFGFELQVSSLGFFCIFIYLFCITLIRCILLLFFY